MEGRMGLRRRSKVLLDTEMYSYRLCLEPAATTPFEVRRLDNPGNVQESLIEVGCSDLSPRWHCKLNMVQGDDCHEASIAPPLDAVGAADDVLPGVVGPMGRTRADY